MDILNIEAFLIAILILTLTPGLDTALVLRNTSRSGAVDGWTTSLGICLGLFVHATLSAVGVSALLLQSAELFQTVKLIGAAYLIWLGIGSLRGCFNHSGSIEVSSTQVSSFNYKRSLREGFLSNVLNPKTAVFYLAFLPQFINPEYSAFTQSLLLAGIHFVLAMVWQCGLASTLNKAQQALKSPKFMQGMEGLTGSVLVLLGVKLMLEDH